MAAAAAAAAAAAMQRRAMVMVAACRAQRAEGRRRLPLPLPHPHPLLPLPLLSTRLIKHHPPQRMPWIFQPHWTRLLAQLHQCSNSLVRELRRILSCLAKCVAFFVIL